MGFSTAERSFKTSWLLNKASLRKKKKEKIENKGSTNDGLVVKSELCFSRSSDGGPSIGLVEGFHCGINLRRQAGLTLSCRVSQPPTLTPLAVSPPPVAPTRTGHLADTMNLFCFSLVRRTLYFLRSEPAVCEAAWNVCESEHAV